MKRPLADVIKFAAVGVAIVTCAATRAGATEITADPGPSAPIGSNILIASMSFDGGEAGLLLTGASLQLEIVRFGDGQRSTSLTDLGGSSWTGSFGVNPYFPFGFQSSSLTGGSQGSGSASSLSAGWTPSVGGGSSLSPTSPTPVANPEPSTVILIGTGLVGLLHRRMRRQAAENKSEAEPKR